MGKVKRHTGEPSGAGQSAQRHLVLAAPGVSTHPHCGSTRSRRAPGPQCCVWTRSTWLATGSGEAAGATTAFFGPHLRAVTQAYRTSAVVPQGASSRTRAWGGAYRYCRSASAASRPATTVGPPRQSSSHRCQTAATTTCAGKATTGGNRLSDHATPQQAAAANSTGARYSVTQVSPPRSSPPGDPRERVRPAGTRGAPHHGASAWSAVPVGVHAAYRCAADRTSPASHTRVSAYSG